MSYSSYFADIYREEQVLKAHGFERWPDDDEMLHYLFDVDDKICALAAELGLELHSDVRGRWSAIPSPNETEPARCRWEAM